MSEEEIEREVQTRVEFKMNEFLTGVTNAAKRNWELAFQTGNPKYQHYQEAFKQMKAMFEKEMFMATPTNNMGEEKRRLKRDIAIDKLVDRLKIRGKQGSQETIRFLIQTIEQAQ